MKKSRLLLLLLLAGPLALSADTEGTRPRPIKPTAPEYPQAEQDAGHEGRVILSIHVRKNGKPHGVEVQSSSGYPALDAAAVAAASKWKFTPATDAAGKKIDADALIPLQFNIPVTPLSFLRQRCARLTKEVQAVRAAKPDAKPIDMDTFAATSGMLFLASSGKPMQERLGMNKRLPEIYEAVIAECEKSPDAIYEDVLAKKMDMLKTPAPVPQPSEQR